MINCLLVDDEPHALEVLEHYIRQIPILHLVGCCDSPLEALKVLKQDKVDLIFLDIHMPQISGMEMARAIDRKFKVVICTAYPDYAVEGYELDVLDYLVKPVPLARFLKTVQKIEDYFQYRDMVKADRPDGKGETIGTGPSHERNHGDGGRLAEDGGWKKGVGSADDDRQADDFIWVKTGVNQILLKIDMGEIRYVEARKNYVEIHHGDKKNLVLLSLKKLEARLPVHRFLRVHKSFIIALSEVLSIEGNMILLKGGKETILLGEAYRPAFFDRIKGGLLGG